MQSIPQPSEADQMGLMALLALLTVICPIYKGYPSEYKPLQSHKYSKGIQGFLALIPYERREKKKVSTEKINRKIKQKHKNVHNDSSWMKVCFALGILRKEGEVGLCNIRNNKIHI